MAMDFAVFHEALDKIWPGPEGELKIRTGLTGNPVQTDILRDTRPGDSSGRGELVIRVSARIGHNMCAEQREFVQMSMAAFKHGIEGRLSALLPSNTNNCQVSFPDLKWVKANPGLKRVKANGGAYDTSMIFTFNVPNRDSLYGEGAENMAAAFAERLTDISNTQGNGSLSAQIQERREQLRFGTERFDQIIENKGTASFEFDGENDPHLQVRANPTNRRGDRADFIIGTTRWMNFGLRRTDHDEGARQSGEPESVARVGRYGFCYLKKETIIPADLAFDPDMIKKAAKDGDGPLSFVTARVELDSYISGARTDRVHGPDCHI